MADELFDVLIALEHRGWQSLCDGTGGDFCRDVLAEDVLLELGDGVIMDRVALTQTLGATQARMPPWTGYQIAGAHLLSVGAKAAAVEYIGTGYPGGGDPAFVATVCSVYRRTGRDWKLVLCRHTG
ncbi:DUF4440 domain-containing protein [Mycolicibacterium mengxianglii]|uniref:DUF4440 domain-containing protein n=1 Tax=Mycolicibacterium mengxianglii TaxID=2736649 RepID=UPI0018EF10F4|nr:DUF4440 domain-containing protein [Mycolicibacterium mengxianglii]